jgi:beta-lysine 5,6-aminomutase beta subunit
MAAELGVGKIFGRGTTPGEVASYLVHALLARDADSSAATAMNPIDA